MRGGAEEPQVSNRETWGTRRAFSASNLGHPPGGEQFLVSQSHRRSGVGTNRAHDRRRILLRAGIGLSRS
jgi:hypothetical protein